MPGLMRTMFASETLGFKARISQAWIAPGVLCIIVFIVKLQLLKRFIAGAFELFNAIAAKECESLNVLGERAARAPQEVVHVANKLIASSINSGIRELLNSFKLLSKTVEALILFSLEIAVGTYACLTVSAVNIAANEAINATEAIIKVTNSTVAAVGRDLNVGLSKLSDFMNDAIGLIGSVEDFITGGDADLHSINLTVSRLNHLNISTNINAKLESLRKDIPTYDQTKSAVAKIISEPFSLIDSRLNATNITFKAADLSPILASNISTCNPAKTVSELSKLENHIATVIDCLCIVCAIAILGAIAIEVWRVRSKWSRLQALASSTNPLFNLRNEKKLGGSKAAIAENMRLITAAETPFIERLILNRAGLRTRWLIRYASNAPLASILLLGLAGLTISLLEVIVYYALRSNIEALKHLAAETTNDLTGQINQAVTAWYNQTNGNITLTEFAINHQVLGWVHQGSQSVNSSLSSFMSSINGEIDSIFGDTPLLQPLQAAVYCLVGAKVSDVEKGLTWIHDHSQISLPRVPRDILLQNMANSTMVSHGKSGAMMVIHSAMNAIHHEIVVQCIVSGVFIAVWATWVFAAYVYAFVLVRSEASKDSVVQTPRSPVLRRNRRAPPAVYVPQRSEEPHIPTKSPVANMFHRFSQMFAGPDRKARMSGLPQRASLYMAESPKTPLRAAQFDI